MGMELCSSLLPSQPSRCQLLLTGVAVEKLRFPRNSENLEDRKCLGKSRMSFIGRPDAILFGEFCGKEFFNSHRP
jgi:hypothetical protein